MYVAGVEISLRDRVATMYNKVGAVNNGERVEVLERQRRFLRVRTDQGVEGWIAERNLVSQEIFDGFQKLAQDAAHMPDQGHGTTRSELNMHLTPSREGEHLYQLKDGERVEILRRATADRNAPKTSASAPSPKTPPKTKEEKPLPVSSMTPKAKPSDADADKADEPEPAGPKPVMEDWYLVRNSEGHVGWVLMRMVDLDVPLDVAQYAEGQRIIGYFVLNTVTETIDGVQKDEPQYLMLLNHPTSGLPYDYNQIRVFTRNRSKHRYETAYRERDMEGYFPVKTGHAVFDKEGDLPTFTIRKMKDGQIVDVTYKMNGPIVRRVLSPEEIAGQKARHDADLAARQQAKAQAKAHKSAKKSSSKKKHH